MVLHGRNLIVSVGGVAVAAAKSCVIEVKAKEIAVNGPDTGAWDEYRSGRKGWKVRTSMLVATNAAAQTMTVLSHAMKPDGYVSDGKETWYGDTPGFHVATFVLESDELTFEDMYTYDLVLNPGHLQDDVHDWLSTYPPEDYPTAIFINDNTPVTEYDVWDVIRNAFGISFVTPSSAQPTSFALLSTPEGGSAWKMDTRGREVKVVREIGDGGIFYNVAQRLKECIGQVGQKVTLTATVSYSQGVTTVMTGTALCTGFDVTSAVGSLAKGNFTFLGSGPLLL